MQFLQDSVVYGNSPRTKKRLSDRRQSHYDKNGGITHDTTVFALALKIY